MSATVPASRRIALGEVNTPVNLLTVPTGASVISARISAYNDGPETAYIAVRAYYGAAGEDDWIVRDYALPPGRTWRENAEVLQAGMFVDVVSSRAEVNFRVNGL
ncbi:hypothetical protein VZ95_11220 [Elstera litoralis]|uniref:Uncharacterized protein n=1 Tax=Elstera litoralis TaxID=552518 RepID=A0A0F3IV42_9PROT|nr:hypothetical protein [Elstera litoralis]KJV09479.1 hypothetical protein VZ95_11220 [Elstera litoralis]